MKMANKVRDKLVPIPWLIPDALHQLPLLEHPLLTLLTSGCHSSSSHRFSHNGPQLLHSGLTSISMGHSPHTHAITSRHVACSQALPHVLSHVGVLSVNTHRRKALRAGLSAVFASVPRIGGYGLSSFYQWPFVCSSLSGSWELVFRHIYFSANQHWSREWFSKVET